MAEILQEFLVESYENLDQLDRDLVALEQDPDSHALLSSIFRVIHTIKGTSGFLAFNQLEAVTHTGESLLSRLRDGTQPMTAETADALLKMVDSVRSILGTIEETGEEGNPDVAPVIAMVNACITDGPRAGAPPAATPPPAATTEPAQTAEPAETAKPAQTAKPGEPAAPAQAAAQAAAEAVAHAAAEAVAPAVAQAAEPGEPAHAVATGPTTAGSIGPPSAPSPAGGEPVAAKAPKEGADESQAPRRSVADTSVRVDVDLLDALMRIVGELVLTRNQLVRGVGDLGDQSVTRTAQRLNLLTSELQENVMKTRMQPIDHLFSKLPRVVRDLSTLCGKKVKVVSEGKETELDRSLLEAVKDPLTHLVRNAVDHGVEAPEVRTANGKGPEGTLTLKAYHEGGNVLVEVTDDGGGINPEVIGRIAVERGVVSRDQLAVMDAREILHLVFQPGFSTAAAVTNVSGRGVGMDVVKTNIERIGGAVDVESTIGVGTTWRLTIPLTLAIIQALTVDCGTERYAIAQSAVRELVFVDGESGQRIEHISGAPVYRLRGKLLPLVRLDETLGFPLADGERPVYIAVVQADSRRFGLVVDRVLNTEEIVVKPLAQRFKDVGVYAGATILGDGKVALILDVQALARRARLSTGERADGDGPDDLLGRRVADRLLVVAVGERRVAIPLDMVTRLESFATERLERVGHREVVQYREEILPIVRLSGILGASSDGEPGQLLVVVYTENGRSAGLAVDRILDIVEDTAAARMEIDDHAVTGSTVVHDRVTELLNVRSAILAADPMFYTEVAEYGAMAEV